MDKLKKMKCIENDVSCIPDNIDSVLEEKKKQYKQLLLQYKNELDNINLYVSLNGRIKRAIDVKLRYLSEL